MNSITSLKRWAQAGDLVKDKIEEISKSGIVILHNVSFSLAIISLLFLVAFYQNNTVSLSWFFLSLAVAFTLIPLLARTGYELTSKFLLVAYVNISILILSAVFGKEMFIQSFYIPTCGLSILLFGKEHKHLQNLGIILSIISYLILDYIIFDQITLGANEGSIMQWSILGAAFITTWITFNKFSDSRALAEEKSVELLKETRNLNEELVQKKEELEKNVQELKVAKRKVEEGSKAKTEFLSTMSHEIRTPLNAIIGMTNLLVKDEPREDQLEQLEILDLSAKTLLALINDVLDFSNIESGKIELEKSIFDLHDLLHGIIESFRFTAENKNINLELKFEEEVPRHLSGDPSRLTQILNNLVSNAVKFTEFGTVELTVRVLRKNSSRVKLEFAVKDTGIGISHEKKDKIFESFTQERTDTTRVFGGTGLGLSISKKLVELQGGRIYLDTEKAIGSTFFVELEYDVTEYEEPVSDVYGNKEQTNLNGSKILLVEDNPINQKVILRFLNSWDVEVAVANDGLEAVSMLKENSFHLILMDLQMPKMDGYEATRQIRGLEDKSKSTIPVIALTAAALNEVREKVLDSGMNDFLTKPFNPLELRGKLKTYILESASK